MPRDPVTVPVTRRTVESALDAIGVADECRDDVGLALTEVCANVVRHAADAVDYTVTVTATATACTIDVRDSGRTGTSGYRFQALPSEPDGPARGRPTAMTESGRGLGIVRAVMDAVQVAAGPGGFAIHMVKRLIFGHRAFFRRT